MQLVGILHALVDLDGIVRLVRLAGLGRHHDDAVCGTRTVDCGGGGILQDFYGLDVGCVHVRQSVGDGIAVDYHQRGTVRRNRTCSAHADYRHDTDLGGGVADGETCNLSLEGGSDIRDRNVDQGSVAFEFGDGTCQVGFRLGSVTYDDDIFKDIVIHFETHVDSSRIACDPLLAAISKAGEFKYGIGRRNIDGIIAIYIGSCSDGGTLDHHGRSDQRAFIIGNHSPDSMALSSHDQGEKRHYKRQ